MEWACRNLLYQAQEQLHGFLRNFPNRFLGGVMRLLIFPRGLRLLRARATASGGSVADSVLQSDRGARAAVPVRLPHRSNRGNPLGLLQEALVLAADRRSRSRSASASRA